MQRPADAGVDGSGRKGQSEASREGRLLGGLRSRMASQRTCQGEGSEWWGAGGSTPGS